jgi:hypothetical protein
MYQFAINNKNIVKNKHWSPIKDVSDCLVKYCKNNNYSNVLEIGPGLTPFPLSNKFIGFNENVDSYISVDIDDEKLPFYNKEIDFIYSRHTLEDIQNPNFAMKEIIRCCKSGYIETPSPIIEMTKGVDGGNSDLYCGYIHHRYIIWSDIKKCEIYFLPKYSSILDNYVNLIKPIEYYNLINNNPLYWNNYFIWKDKEPKIINYKNGINFHLNVDNYIKLLNESLNTYMENTDYFYSNYMK